MCVTCSIPKEYCGSCPALEYCSSYAKEMSAEEYIQFLKDEGRENEIDEVIGFICKGGF